MRLERSGTVNDDKLLIFQFHKGAIRTTYQNRLLQEQFNFNSIKVRLEQQLGGYYDALTSFQFHKGAIRTQPTRVKPCRPTTFQFHKGAIRTR